MAEVEEKGHRADTEGFTQDGTVDLKGRPILRSKGGRWKACSFIVGYEVFERMSYYGVATNLILYLTNRLYEGTVTSSNHVTNWVGTVWMAPILGAYIADAHLGRYWTFVISSCIYLLGMCLLTLSVALPWLKPPYCNGPIDKCRERVQPYQYHVFYTALYIIALGTGGTKPNISTMGADQFDVFEPKERTQKLSFFNWWMFSIFFGTLFSNTFLVYIQDNVGWALGYGLPTIGLALSLSVFLVGTPFYRHKLPSGSPFTRMARVLVAAIRKWRVPHPDGPKELHELPLENYTKMGIFRIDHTPSLRFLDKAAVKSGPTTPWMLCSVTHVEETKQMLKMIPILVVTFIPSSMMAQVHTLFIKQGTTLDRSMGPHFKIPPASLTAFVTIAMLISLVIYDRYFVPAIRKYTKNPRGITLLQRMGIGLVMHVTILLIASFTEKKRLSYAREHGILGAKETVPLTIFILLPQFIIAGIADTFVEVAKIEFFYDQAPVGMKSLGTSYFTSSLGIGNFLSSFFLTTVSDITKRHGHEGWVQNNLNTSHLDYYYAFLAVLNALNLCLYIFVTKFYVYKIMAWVYYLLLFSLALPLCRADPIGEYCSGDITISNSQTSANINHVLVQLVAKAPVNGFAIAVSRSGSNRVYGLVQCRQDVSTKDCSTCTIDAAKKIRKLCPTGEDARIWYDYCFLRYSTEKFIGKSDTGISVIYYNVQNVTDGIAFDKEVGNVMDRVKAQALVPANRGLGKDKTKFSPYVNIYGLVQCTRDLSKLSCAQCLATAIANFENYCQFRQGCQVNYSSCRARYEIYPFFFPIDSDEKATGSSIKVVVYP